MWRAGKVTAQKILRRRSSADGPSHQDIGGGPDLEAAGVEVLIVPNLLLLTVPALLLTHRC